MIVARAGKAQRPLGVRAQRRIVGQRHSLEQDVEERPVEEELEEHGPRRPALAQDGLELGKVAGIAAGSDSRHGATLPWPRDRSKDPSGGRAGFDGGSGLTAGCFCRSLLRDDATRTSESSPRPERARPGADRPVAGGRRRHHHRRLPQPHPPPRAARQADHGSKPGCPRPPGPTRMCCAGSASTSAVSTWARRTTGRTSRSARTATGTSGVSCAPGPEEAGTTTWWSLPWPMPDGIAAIARHRWPDPDDPGRYRGLRERARQLHDETDYAVVLQVNCAFFLRCAELRGWENFYADLAANPQFACALMNHYLDIRLRMAERALQEAGGCVDVVVVTTDDLGMTDRTIVSPAMYRELIKPIQKRMFDFFKARTDALRLCPLRRRRLPADRRLDRDRGAGAESRAGLGRGNGRHGKAEGGVRRSPRVLGRHRHPPGASLRHPGGRAAGGAPAHPGPRAAAAATCSARSTTSSPKCRRRTSSPCSTRPTSWGDTRWTHD